MAAVLLLGVALVPPIAGAAGLGGTTAGSESVTAAEWGVTASVTSMTFTGSTDQTTNVTNSGTVALVAQSYSVTVSKTSGNPTFRVFQCAVAWVSSTCSGGAGTQIGGALAKNSTTTITSPTAMAAGAILYLQVEPASVGASTVVTISTLITAPSQIQAGVMTNQ